MSECIPKEEIQVLNKHYSRNNTQFNVCPLLLNYSIDIQSMIIN